MTGYIILSGIIGILLLIGYIIFKKNADLKDDLKDEKEKVVEYKKQFAKTKELKKKADEIDRKIEVKKNERKKMSKSEKIAAANRRGSSD